MIARKSALVFLNTLVGAFLGLFAIKLVALYLGKDLVNPVEFTLGFLGLLYFLTDLGFGSAHTKRVSEGLDEGDCLATFTVFKVVATGAFLLAGAAVVVYVTLVRPGTLQDATPGVLLLILAYYSVKSLGSIPNATFDARRETARGQVAVLAENVVRIALTAVLALVFAGAALGRGPLAGVVAPDSPVLGWFVRNPSAALAGTYLVGTIVAAVVAFAYIRRTTRFGRFRWDILRGYWEFALPLTLISAVAIIASNVDRAALGFFGESGEAALFGYARRITIFIETIPIAVAALLFPTISAHHGRGEAESIREIREQASRYISLVVAPVVVFTVVFSRQIIHIFLSDEWLPAAGALSLLAVFSLVLSMTYPYTTLLTGTGRVGRAARIAAVVAVMNIVLNLLLIPRDLAALGFPGVRLAGLGVTGAALASVASASAGYVLFRRESARHLHVRDVFLVKHLVAAFAMAGVLVGLEALVIGANPLLGDLGVRWYHLAAMGVVGGVVYLGVLALLREFGRADVRYFFDIVHPGEMLDYVARELHLGKHRRRP